MTAVVGIDIRYPIGGLFSALGLVIGGYGIATRDDVARYAHLDGLNVNLWWGVVMLAFGLLCLALARRADRKPTTEPTPVTPPATRP